MKYLIAANWKLNPQTSAEAQKLVRDVSKVARTLKNVETVICPPFIYLEGLRDREYRVGIGTQNVFWEEKGAYTGEVSPKMLKNLGISYVIIGHSERRRHLGETDEMINKKVRAALKNGLRVILCIGETKEEHQRGQTPQVLARQLKKDLAGIKINALRNRPHALTIAYEPIWAIGTGIPETPYNANDAALFIRKRLAENFGRKYAKNIRILYGGSTNAKNILGFLAMSEIQGALVGGASLNAKEFSKMLQIAEEI